jgi:hypothetical protein
LERSIAGCISPKAERAKCSLPYRRSSFRQAVAVKRNRAGGKAATLPVLGGSERLACHAGKSPSPYPELDTPLCTLEAVVRLRRLAGSGHAGGGVGFACTSGTGTGVHTCQDAPTKSTPLKAYGRFAASKEPASLPSHCADATLADCVAPPALPLFLPPGLDALLVQRDSKRSSPPVPRRGIQSNACTVPKAQVMRTERQQHLPVPSAIMVEPGHNIGMAHTYYYVA